MKKKKKPAFTFYIVSLMVLKIRTKVISEKFNSKLTLIYFIVTDSDV